MGRKKKNKLHKKKRGGTYNKKKLKNAILSTLYENPGKTVNYRQISGALSIKDPETRKLINVALQELADDGYVDQLSRGKFKLKARTGKVTGIIEMQPQGFAYVISDELEQPAVISSRNLNHAMEGDKVRIHVYARRKKHDLEGEVTEILERAKTIFVGKVQTTKNFAFLVPAGKVGFDIFIPKEKLNGAKDGQKAIAEIKDWPQNARSPFGEIIEVLGDTGDNDAEMHAILAEFELPHKFPQNVDKAAEKIPLEIQKEEIKKRRDMRKTTTFTIDPADAKDFDDALSLKKLDNGNWEVGVHIADVTHYVRPNTIIENEAQDRATSVYLVDRVVPMLPERLSNGVCSLRPNEDKLCFSAVFEITEDAKVKKQWFGKTVIHSDRRFTYEEAQEIIETGQGDFSEEVLKLNELAIKLRDERFDSGSIAFERVEMKFEIDEKGKPISVSFKESKESNHLIEEFMLLANKKVAEFIGKVPEKKTPKTFVYRIHDKPDPDKLSSFNTFIKRFGHGIQLSTPRAISTSLNKLLTEVKGKNEQNVVETLAIRTMAKAAYSTRNIGHYGLSFDYYTHFTSPIRRYPDMMVHRLLEKYLDGARSANEQKYEGLCKHSSDMEAKAANAERASIKYKQVEFMQDHIGKTYPGTISGVTDWGIYVELENKIEGMIPIAQMDDDFYIFDEKNYALVGRHSRKSFQLGEKINVRVWRTNLERKQLDFRLAEQDNG
ncbi:ribonuclease R [Draconibacterium orientale]|uniref:Ribonuclease R n=1 Tax=Draconibacterium orientale TaxID=1168034 RepID=X5DWY1_9BACT|nr:ribonuclease R [Draconibacterium orientale]AHW59730.1 ribonuclease R [Draconibacterium orientale]SES77041.1 ribonuclease R [Draconibacterium orientale]